MNTIAEYEVFRNERNALAFFFSHVRDLDRNAPEGPFWFTIDEGRISAGTGISHATFEDLQPAVLDIARERGVIMLVEFENQQPTRCTPCYISDRF